jgi:hypothetical protein
LSCVKELTTATTAATTTKISEIFHVLIGLLFPQHLARAGFSTISNKEEGC